MNDPLDPLLIHALVPQSIRPHQTRWGPSYTLSGNPLCSAVPALQDDSGPQGPAPVSAAWVAASFALLVQGCSRRVWLGWRTATDDKRSQRM